MHGLIPANPVQQVVKPKQLSTGAPDPLSPEQVDRIRFYMLTRSWSSEMRGTGRSPWSPEWWRKRSALIVSLLAYAGFRPSEYRSLVWSDLRGNVLYVVGTKTNRPRQVDVLDPLAKELAEWQLLCGRPTGRQLIIPRTVPGPWTKNDWDNWRGRVYRPAAKCVLAHDADRSHPYRVHEAKDKRIVARMSENRCRLGGLSAVSLRQGGLTGNICEQERGGHGVRHRCATPPLVVCNSGAVLPRVLR